MASRRRAAKLPGAGIGKLLSVRDYGGRLWPDPSHRQVAELFLRMIPVALFAFGLDVAGSLLPVDLVYPESARDAFVTSLVQTFTLPALLLVAVATIAVGTLSSYGDPGLLLLQRRYPEDWGHFALGWIIGRSNLFYFTLFCSIALVVSVLAIELGHAVGLTRESLVALTFLALLVLINTVAVVTFLFWVLRLARADDVINETYDLGENLLGHMWRTAERKRSLTLDRRQRVTSAGSVMYEEQEELLQVLIALTDAGTRAVRRGEPHAATQAILALQGLHASHAENVTRRHSPSEWFRLRDRPPADWVSELIAQGLGRILVLSAREGDGVVIKVAAAALVAGATHIQASVQEGIDAKAAALAARAAFEMTVVSPHGGNGEISKLLQHSLMQVEAALQSGP